MSYRDELSAAKRRAAQLSEQVDELSGQAAQNDELREQVELLQMELAEAREAEAALLRRVAQESNQGSGASGAPKPKWATPTLMIAVGIGLFGILGVVAMLLLGVSDAPSPPEERTPVTVNKKKAPRPAVVPSSPTSPATPTAEERLSAEKKAAKKAFCSGLLACYSKHEAWGPISIDVTLKVKGDGSAGAVTVKGTPPPKVRVCLAQTAKKNRAANYSLGPGTARCITTGNITPGARMINFSSQLKLDAPPSAKEVAPQQGQANPLKTEELGASQRGN